MSTLTNLLERGNSDLTLRAIRMLGIDLASEWADLDDDQRDQLVADGVVTEVDSEVECTDAESWQSDWRSESGAAWPTYTLEITAEGMTPIEVTGWHLVGRMSPDHQRHREHWGESDGDSVQSGLPATEGWWIESGDGVGERVRIPVWRQDDGTWASLAREGLDDAMRKAADTADHGGEPTWEDVTKDDVESDGVVYVIRDHEIVEIEVCHGGVAGWDKYEWRGDEQRRTCTYWAEAWMAQDEFFATRDDLIASLKESDGEVYADEDDAAEAMMAAVAGLADDLPEEFELGGRVIRQVEFADDYVAADVDDVEYTLDVADMTHVLRFGWPGILADRFEFFTDGVTIRERCKTYRSPPGSVNVHRTYASVSLAYARWDGKTLNFPSDAGAVAASVVGADDKTGDLALADMLDESGLADAAEVARLIRAAVALTAE